MLGIELKVLQCFFHTVSQFHKKRRFSPGIIFRTIQKRSTMINSIPNYSKQKWVWTCSKGGELDQLGELVHLGEISPSLRNSYRNMMCSTNPSRGTSLDFAGVLSTIIFVTFWDFLMFYQIFFSPQVKQCAIITYKHSMYKLPHELPNDWRLTILGS